LHGSALQFCGSFTNSQVSLTRMEFIFESIASFQLATSVAPIASLYVVGSLASMKRRLGENRSGGRDSLSDRCGKTGLAGSSAVVLCTSELVSAKLVGSSIVGLLGFGVTAPSILRGWADREANLVCCAGPSNRVGTSTNPTLYNSIGRSAALCMAESLNTMSKLRTS
jgi:hypothetical protein